MSFYFSMENILNQVEIMKSLGVRFSKILNTDMNKSNSQR